MFRKMRRFKQQLSSKECAEVLITQTRGVLSVLGDGGYPYGVPLNHYYDEENNKIYFHCAKEGHKIDAIKNCDKVCYTVFDAGYREDGDWALNVKSVIVFGRISTVDDEKKKAQICTLLCTKFPVDDGYAEREIAKFIKNVQCLEIDIEHITGKLVNES